MIHHVRCRSSLLALSSLFLCSLLPAATYLPMSDADLARLAPTVVRAEVVEQAVRVERIGGRDLPFTVVTLRPLETFKGELREETFRVRLPGGMVEDRAWALPGTPQFEDGQEVVLMLDLLPDGTKEHRLTEFGLSKFDIVADEAGRRFAVRSVFTPAEDLELSRAEEARGPQSSGDPSRVPARDAESFLFALRALRGAGELARVDLAVPTGELARAPRGALRLKFVNLGRREPGNMFRWFWDTADSPTATVKITGTQTNLTNDDSCGTDSNCYVTNAVTGWHGVAQTDIRIEGPSPTGNLNVILDAPMSQDGGVAWNTPVGCSGGVLGLGGPAPSPFQGPFKGDPVFFAPQDGTASMRKSTCATGYSGKVFKTVVIHEIGHVLGLNHPNQYTSIHSTTPAPSWQTAVMVSSVPPSTPSTPQTDDIQGMQYYYGTAATGAAPAANFSFSPASPSAGVAVSFTDTSTNSPKGWSWDFADGAPIAEDRNPSHVFSLPGTYNVKLYAGSANGTGIATKVLVVGVGPSTCTPNATTLCLNAGRFKVTADWEKKDTTRGQGTAVLLTPDAGYFWFFNSTNIEVVTKLLAFCANPFNAYWIFAAGLTDVKVTLTYTDTKNGTVVTKENPQGTAFVAIQDTAAFKTCP